MKGISETISHHFEARDSVPPAHEREIGMLCAQWFNIQKALRLGEAGDHASANTLGNLAFTNVGQILDDLSSKYPHGYPVLELRPALSRLRDAWRDFTDTGAHRADAELRRALH